MRKMTNKRVKKSDKYTFSSEHWGKSESLMVKAAG